ncbi:hypothetical protein GX586_00825 [bacterium]|nr:hypothetical protein [bacterium]
MSMRLTTMMCAVACLLGVAPEARAQGDVIYLDAIVRGAKKEMTFVIPDFGDAQGIARIVKADLIRHGAFIPITASDADIRTLDSADRQKGTVHFRNWANLGAQLLGKGAASGTAQLSVEFTLYSPANGKRVFGKRYAGAASSYSVIAHTIADDIIVAVLGGKGFFTSKLLFVKGSTGTKNIYLCDADGRNQRALTHYKTLCLFPDWYPDRQHYVFSGYMEGRPILYKGKIAGGDVQRLLARPGMNTSPAVSPDGSSMAVILDQDGQPELYVVNLSSGNRKRLTAGRAVESSPAWSPDSRQIAYSSDESTGKPQIYLISASGGKPRRLTTSARSPYCASPAWSPDGKKICFVAQVAGNFDICMYDLASNEMYQLTNDPSNDEQPSWARDSRHIAFARVHGSGARLMLLDSETGKSSTLVQDAPFCGQPAWEP